MKDNPVHENEKKKAPRGTAEIVRELIEPTVTAEGVSIWDVEYVKEGADYYLRVTLDSPEGIDIDDCERVHRAIDPVLDEADPISGSYILEVSSPGIERHIRTAEHYHACIGETVNVKLFTAISDVPGEKGPVKQLRGVLSGYDDESGAVTLAVGEQEIELPKAMVSRTTLYFDFDA